MGVNGLRHVLEPIEINGVTIKNRVVRTAHGTQIGRGRMNEDLIAYHVARAKGGVGLTVTEAASIHRTDEGTLRLHDDSCIADFRNLMKAVEGTGMTVFAQLNHLGHDGKPMPPYTEPWSASAVRSPGYGWQAHAMTLDEIEEMVDCFARVAGWLAEAGVHGIEVHAAHGYLLQQFYSPITNHRDDQYGGSFENRLRFTMEVVGAVRRAIGPDLPLGIRTGADATEDGLQADDCADLVRAVVDTGWIDYVNVTYGSARRPAKIIGAMHEPCGYELPTSEVVTKATLLPTIVTGRFRTLEEADEVIRLGMADMVGMTRAHIADPDIVVKTMSGRADEVRPCLGCNQGCLGGFSLGRMACTLNADVGFEAQRVGAYDRVATARKVMVIGGGPAGLEAARVAALRGHQVTLFEAQRDLGGMARWSRRFPDRQAIWDGIDWLINEMDRQGVEVYRNSPVDDATVAAIDPDVIVVATGARHVDDAGPLTSVDVARMEQPPPGVAKVAVVDRVGGYEAIGVSETFIRWGIDVDLVTPFKMLGAKIYAEQVVAPFKERMAVAPAKFTARTGWDPAEGVPEADLVMVIDAVANPLGLGEHVIEGREVHVIGDAAEPGNLWAAVRTGNEVGRLI